MKNLYILSIFLISYSLSAQKLEQEDFEKAVDFATCTLINASEKSSFSCTEYEEISEDNIKADKTKLLFKELNRLKQASHDNSKEFLSYTIFNDEKSYPEIYAFAQRRKGQELDNIKSDVAQYFTNSSKWQSLTNADLHSTNDVQQQFTSDITPLSNSELSIWNYSLYDIVFALLIIILSYLVFTSKSRIIKLEKKSSDFRDRTINPAVNNEAKLNATLDELAKLRTLVNTLRDKLGENPRVVISETRPEVIVTHKIPTQPAEDAFYMATPSDEKQFDESSMTQSFKPTQTLYKFIVDAQNKNLAKFVFQSDVPGIRDSVNAPQTYLEPVCEPINALNQSATKITTVKHGTAEKRNDKWIVIIKAQIKYE